MSSSTAFCISELDRYDIKFRNFSDTKLCKKRWIKLALVSFRFLKDERECEETSIMPVLILFYK